MKKLFFFLCISIAIVSCKETVNPQVQTKDISFTKEGELTLLKADGTPIKTLDVEFAETDYERQTGLMYRKSMEDSQSMLFIFKSALPQNFYMKNTFIPLDIIYIDQHKKIVSFQKNAKPLNEEGLPSEVPAMYVLEIKAGLADAWNLEVGDRISFLKN